MEFFTYLIYSIGVIISAWLHCPTGYKEDRAEYICTETVVWIIVSICSWITVTPILIDYIRFVYKQTKQ